MATAAGPQLTRPDVLAVVETMQIINTVLERLASREEELRLWARVRTPTKTKFSQGCKRSLQVVRGLSLMVGVRLGQAERGGGEPARTALAGVLFHALDVVHASGAYLFSRRAFHLGRFGKMG